MPEPGEQPAQRITLDASQIQALIPHRYPFLLVDRSSTSSQANAIVGTQARQHERRLSAGPFPGLPGHAGRADRRSDGPGRRRAGHARPGQCRQAAVLCAHRQLPLPSAGAPGRHAAPGSGGDLFPRSGRQGARARPGRQRSGLRGRPHVCPRPGATNARLALLRLVGRSVPPSAARSVASPSGCCCSGPTTSATCCSARRPWRCCAPACRAPT